MIYKIDTNIWATPTQYAALHKVSIQVVQNWMNRKKVEVWVIEELNLKLIKKLSGKNNLHSHQQHPGQYSLVVSQFEY